MKTTYIYGLEDPISNQIRYIGKSNNPRKRCNEHLYLRKDNTQLNNWIRQLISVEMKPKLIILEGVPMDDWKEKERYWIAYGKEQNWPLTNVQAGGESPPAMTGKKRIPCSDETRRKISLSHMGVKRPTYVKRRPSSEETKRKQSISMIGKNVGKYNGIKKGPPSNETREKISKALTGKAMSKEAREKMSIKAKQRAYSPERREKMRQIILQKMAEGIWKLPPSNKGKTHTEETKRKISQTHKDKRIKNLGVEA